MSSLSPNSSSDVEQPSDVDRSAQPPRFYVDTSLGGRAIPNLVRELGYEAVTKADQFGGRRVEDTEWIGWCGEQGFVALTKDDRIRHRTAEATALVEAGLLVFCLTNANLKKDEQVNRFRQHWPSIIEACSVTRARMIGVYSDRIEELKLS